MLTLKTVMENAKKTALRDGYNQVIILEHDGSYGFSRDYDGCCPDWLGKIIGKYITFWENGILNVKYIEV